MKLNLEIADYYTQNNNKRLPMQACMPTARVMFYLGNNIPFHVPAGEAADDYFMRLLRSEEAWQFCRRKYPWTVNRTDWSGRALPDIPPNEVHGMYGSWLDERVTGRRRTDFVTSLTFLDSIRLVEKGRVIMTAGQFPGTAGHAVCIIGRMCNGVLLIADPRGDYRKDYEVENGYMISFTQSEFEKTLSGTRDQKWAHLLLEDL